MMMHHMGVKARVFNFILVLGTVLLCVIPFSIAGTAKTNINIATINDLTTPYLWKQQKIAMDLAVLNYNNNLTNYNLSLVYQNYYSGDPLQVANAAEKLVKRNGVQAIIGTATWSEAALVADVGKRMNVPVLSFVSEQSLHNEFPFLVQMLPNGSEQLKLVADIVQSRKWRRIVLIYEEDIYGGDSGLFAQMSKELLRVGSFIYSSLAFPPFSTLSDPEQYIREEMKKMDGVQSRAFIVLRLSFQLTNVLFSKAKKMGFMGKESAWLVTDTVAGFLDSADTSLISSMEGVVGIRTGYYRDTQSFKNFSQQFQDRFKMLYPDENAPIPGIQAIRAYDSIGVVAEALEKIESSNDVPSNLLSSILASNFTGLSGQVVFNEGRLSNHPNYEIIHVNSTMINVMELRNESIVWPGNLEWVGKGWAMPTNEKPLIVGVPGQGSFDNFVKITHDKAETFFNGFCIEVFREVVKILFERKLYRLPVEFRKFDGSYNDLVDHLANGTFDAIVGDLTINAERWDKVEFTEPFTESGLATVVPVRTAHKGWIFLKPFTLDMWLATGALLFYTMFMVWFMEHRSNPDFSGSWKDQLAHSLWFAFTSLFLAHREKIQSNYTRVVVVVWLFVALVLTQSFTASLTSMLTIPQLSSIDINSLGRSNMRVGCDENDFMNNFLKESLGYKSENVVNLSTEAEYLDAFKNDSISAAILEIPYAKVFVNKNCNKYTITGSTYRFGGFGFAFQKGSPLASDVSEAILVISEKGTLKRLEEEFLTPSSQCSLELTSAKDVDGLSLNNFWGLFVFSLATSTTCFLLFVACLLRNYWSQVSLERNLNRSFWVRTLKLAQYLSSAEASPRAPDHVQQICLRRMPINFV